MKTGHLMSDLIGTPLLSLNKSIFNGHSQISACSNIDPDSHLIAHSAAKNQRDVLL